MTTPNLVESVKAAICGELTPCVDGQSLVVTFDADAAAEAAIRAVLLAQWKRNEDFPFECSDPGYVEQFLEHFAALHGFEVGRSQDDSGRES